ncbi:oxidoreductase [Cephaloticoccus capnophilus]|uniref:Oxidoreductase n=1 Tax=Cephaloticoccus capnophilus TaxID=1548208 RepID=A0A139SM80_9BACT|nr:Gfo/Idh/MocA family oxidoreductase [Cephaloticoccus capnophilus]KXU35645.1 oxidoreductase [Cephaloticoccus capnophilus]
MSQAKKSVKVGLIGCGNRGTTVVKHLLEGAGSDQIELAALYDPRAGATAALNTKLGTAAVAQPSLDALLADSGIDWVIIASPNCHHVEQASAALRAGKHVFCEKPLATTFEDCLRLREARLAAPDRHFFFGLVLRYTPLYQKAKELLASGILGKLISFEFNETLSFTHGGYIHGNWRRYRDQAGTHLLEKCCHDIDLVNWLIDSLPVRAASFGGKDVFAPKNRHLAEAIGPDENGRPAYRGWPDPEGIDPFSEGATIVDNQVAILEYANGARATFHTNCNCALPERRMYLVGTEGTLLLNAITNTITHRKNGHKTEPETFALTAGDMHLGGDAFMASHLRATMLESKAPLAGIDDGYTSAISAFGIDQAMDSGQVVDMRGMWTRAGVHV